MAFISGTWLREMKLQLSIFAVLIGVFLLFLTGNPTVFTGPDIYYSFMSTIPLFGIMALADAILSVFHRIKLWGLDEGLLHRSEDPEATAATHFAWTLKLNVLVFLACVAASFVLVRFYDPKVVYVLILLAFLDIVHALSLLSPDLHKR